MAFSLEDAVSFEQRFWLQIMGDHARFIFFSLAPSETEEIAKAQSFISSYDNLLNKARQRMSVTDSSELLQQASQETEKLKAFKLHLLSLTLDSKLKIGLSSTFFNHMLNELEEYATVLDILKKGQVPSFHLIHYHLLWLSDAIGHAAGVSSNLDEVEEDIIDNSNVYEKNFYKFVYESNQLRWLHAHWT